MKISRLTQLKSHQYKVIWQDLSEIIVDEDIVVKYNLFSSKSFSQAEIDEIRIESNRNVLYNKALKYLGIKMRSQKELIKYLKCDDAKTVDYVIDKLKKQGYLNSQVYVTSYIDDQINFNYNGPYKIKKNLLDLGLEEEIIDAYLSTIDKNIWLDKINKYTSKKVKSNAKYSTSFLKNKLSNELINLGYDQDLIRDSLAQIKANEKDQELFKKEYDKLYQKYSQKYSGYKLNQMIKSKLYAKGFNSSEFNEIE